MKSDISHYNIPLIIFAVVILYICSSLLVKKKIINLPVHRKIWNVFLLTVFLANLITDFYLILGLTTDIRLDPPFNLSFWHIQTGVVFIIIAILHALWHWPYFKRILK